MKQSSLGEIAIKLGINKSKLAYYFSMGLLKPLIRVGRMNIFDEDKVTETIKNIKASKKAGKKLKEI